MSRQDNPKHVLKVDAHVKQFWEQLRLKSILSIFLLDRLFYMFPVKSKGTELEKQYFSPETSRLVLKIPYLLCLPAKQSQLARPIFIHDDPQWQGDGWQQEGAHCKGQVQHLILFFTNQPAIHPQGPIQRLSLHYISGTVTEALTFIVVRILIRCRCWQGLGQIIAGTVNWRTWGVQLRWISWDGCNNMIFVGMNT